MRSVRSIIIIWHTQAFQLTRTLHAILFISHCVPIFCMRRTYRYILTQESPVSYLDSIHTWNHTTVYTKLLHNLSKPKNTCSCLKVNTSTQICWNKIQYIQKFGILCKSGKFHIRYLHWSWSHELKSKTAIQICTRWGRREGGETHHNTHLSLWKVLTRNNKHFMQLEW